MAARLAGIREGAEIAALLLRRHAHVPDERLAHAGARAQAAAMRARLQRLKARFQQHACHIDPAALDQLRRRRLRIPPEHAIDLTDPQGRFGAFFEDMLLSDADYSSLAQ